jgi:membrane protein YdbS with pleckstrin-like domain
MPSAWVANGAIASAKLPVSRARLILSTRQGWLLPVSIARPRWDIGGVESVAGIEPEQWRTPSRRLLRLRRLEVGVPAFVAVLVLALAGAVTGSGAAFGFAGAAVVVGAALWRFVGRRFRSWGYAERDDDLLVRRGVMFARLSVVPYGRMQFIDVTAGPLERSFGLATVRLHTAAAATDARIPGLEQEEAARLRDRLAELGEAQAAGL